jgi:hypothetical protein
MVVSFMCRSHLRSEELQGENGRGQSEKSAHEDLSAIVRRPL